MPEIKHLTCPRCQAELKGYMCSNNECATDIRDVVLALQPAFEDWARTLVAMGAFATKGFNHLVVPSTGSFSDRVINPAKCRSEETKLAQTILRQTVGGSPKGMNLERVQDFIAWTHANSHYFPVVHHRGDKPQLFWNPEDDTLFWPWTKDTPQCRCFTWPRPNGAPDGIYYTGPILTPRPNGSFEEWLGSLLCKDEISRDVVRGWMLASLCPSLYPWGQLPMLLFVAALNGAGKSTTTNVISRILGREPCVIHWERLTSVGDLTRQVMDPEVRVVTIDNIAPAAGEVVFDSSPLATFITSDTRACKRLYDYGQVSMENRTALLGSANSPVMSSELLSRVLPSVLDPAAPKIDDWQQTWESRRVELLEDMLYTAIEGWNGGPMPPCKRPCRFRDWQRVVTRLLQREPVLYPQNGLVRSPLEVALDDLWRVKANGSGRLPWNTVEEWFMSAQTPILRVVRQQVGVTREMIAEDLAKYQSRYRLVDDYLEKQ